MTALEKIKNLQANSFAIRELFNRKIPHWKTDPKHYDKTGWGFNQDDRFSACKGVLVWFDSHCGVYGNSGCSSQLSLSEPIFHRHLLGYLNTHKKEIMLEIADNIDREALKHKDEAEHSLTEELNKLKKLGEKSE